MGPLEGIRVVELSTGIAGPVAGMLFGDYGAEVVKVEAPAGDPARALPGFAVWNRNKQSIVIDAASASGRRRLTELLAGADVCIAGDPAPTGVLGLEAATAANPGLIYLHMPPYTPSGTPWAGGRESGGLLSAVAGPSCRQSSFDGGPIHLVYPFPLYIQGHWGAACAVAALIDRERAGVGQVVTVAGIHGVLVSSPHSFVIDPAQPPLPTNVGPGGRHPTYTTYQCQDGQWLFMAALIPKFQANAFKTLGVGDIFADPRIHGEPSRMVLPENRGWIRQRLADAFASRPRDEWLQRLEEGDCPAGPMGDRDEWLDHPQVCHNDLRAEVDDPERGRIIMPGVYIGLSKTPGAVRTPAPRLGQHDATAGRWQPRPRPTARPTEPGKGPLAGYRVLDLGTILAGPYAGSMLASLGADVIKVESPAGDAFRETGFVYNAGMRSLSIDLSSPAGQAAFHRLAGSVDAVIDNSRLGVLKRLRGDYATLCEHNPAIVSFSIAGFGERGPMAHKPAFDPVLQAMSGIMSAQGGDSDPVLFTIPINDVAAGATSVLAICLGLFHRARTGQGQRAVTSLVASSLAMQSGELVRFAGRPPSVLGGRDYLGPSANDRYYRSGDGWVRVEAPSVAALVEALGIPRSPAAEAEEACGAIAEVLASMPSTAALARLNEAGIPAVPARHPAEAARDADIQALDLLSEHHLPDGTPFLMAHRYARFSRDELDRVLQAPGVGEHSRQVLAEGGLSEAEIDGLIRDQVVVAGSPLHIKALVNYR